MRKLFYGTRGLPTRQEVINEVDAICKKAGVRSPRWSWQNDTLCQSLPEGIIMSDPDFVRSIDSGDPDTIVWRYWLTVLHETGHWIDAIVNNHEADHCPKMFAIYLALYMERHLPLDILWISESRYKPGSLTRGMKLMAEAVMREGSPVIPTSTLSSTAVSGIPEHTEENRE